MTRSSVHPSGVPPRPLLPRDLFDSANRGDAVTVSVRLSSVALKSTKGGEPWAALEGLWRGHRLLCLVFPTTWAGVSSPALGDGIGIEGTLLFREGEPVIWVHQMTTLSLA